MCDTVIRLQAGHIYVHIVCSHYISYPDTRTCATCWTALWHLDTLCYEGCEGHGSAYGLPQPRMELAERRHEQTYLGWYC